MIETMKKVHPSFDRIDECEIINGNGEKVGWHSVVFDNKNFPLSGGTAVNQFLARRIAISECLERGLIDQIRVSEQARDFDLESFPTSCGFAFGFESESTMFRSISEAVERWVRSKWIDEGCYLKKVKVDVSSLSPLAQHFYHQFHEVFFFYKKMSVRYKDKGILPLHIGITIGFNEHGAFSGQRVGSLFDELWTHSLLESWRHFHIAQNMTTNTESDFSDIFTKRILYFSQNKQSVLNDLRKCQKREWPTPELKIVKELKNNTHQHYLWRSLCEDYMSWDQGSESRFVY